jgi:uncharacterized protein (TIGR00369 family)
VSESLPNSRDCFVCGIDNSHGFALKFRREDGRVFTYATLPQWTVGFRETAHGGIVATLLDEAMSWAATCHAQGPTATAEMTVRFRRPTPVDQELRLEAEVVKARGALLYVEARLLQADGQLCANSSGKHMKLPKSADEKFELVYGPEDVRIFKGNDG